METIVFVLLLAVIILSISVWRAHAEIGDEASRRRDLDWRHQCLRREFDAWLKDVEPFGEDESRILKRLTEILSEATEKWVTE